MSYDTKRRVLFAVLAVIIVLSWAPLRANFSDVAVFCSVLFMIIGGYWGIERLIGKIPKDE
jgi:hypothetical protein